MSLEERVAMGWRRERGRERRRTIGGERDRETESWNERMRRNKSGEEKEKMEK